MYRTVVSHQTAGWESWDEEKIYRGIDRYTAVTARESTRTYELYTHYTAVTMPPRFD